MNKMQGTFELWVKPLDLSLKPQAFMVVNTTAGIPHNYQIQYWTNGKLYFRANKAGQEVSVLASSVGFTQDIWHHLAMTWDSSGVVAYVDGNPVGSYTSTMTFTNELVGDLFVGAWFDTSRNSEAVIDEVRIWDVALTADQVKASYDLRNGTQIKEKDLDDDGYPDVIFTSAFKNLTSPDTIIATILPVDPSVQIDWSDTTMNRATPRRTNGDIVDITVDDLSDSGYSLDITVFEGSPSSKTIHIWLYLTTEDHDHLGVNAHFLR